MSQPNLPESIKFLWTNYKIQDWPHKEANSARSYGQVDHMLKVIKLDQSFGPKETANTLIHEILHVIWNGTHISENNDPNEEFMVSIHADSLCAIWLDNPKFADWFNWAIRQEA